MRIITLDFETFYGDGYSLSLKNMTTEKYIRDERFKAHGASIKINNGPTRWVTAKHLPTVLQKLNLESSALCGHNLQFDGSILAWHYGIVPKLYLDTLGMARAMVGPHSNRHGLDYVAPLLLGTGKKEGLAKTYNVRDLPPALERKLAEYCDHDVEMTWGILNKMLPLFPLHELHALDWVVRAFTCPKLYLDHDLLMQYHQEVVDAKQEALEAAGLTTRDLLMSNQKYAEALENLGVQVPTKVNKNGKVTFAFAKTDEEHKALLDHEDIRVQALVAARIANKTTIEETRALAYADAALRGAWPVAYSYAGANVTQRLSGNKGGGGNPQNMKRGGTIRRAVYAPEGYQVGVADLSQIEARITLWLGMQIAGPESEEAKALKVMAEGGDIYSWFGSKIYGITITKETHPFERQVAKSAVLGLGYGMGWERFIVYCLQMGIKGIDEQFAKDIVALYRQTFKGVATFWRQCTDAIKALAEGEAGYVLPCETKRTAPNPLPLVETGYDPLFNGPGIKRPNGLWIKYPQLRNDPDNGLEYWNGKHYVRLFGGKICENIVQAIAADIMRDQLVKMNKHYPVCMQTHDEVVCLIPEEDADIKAWDEYKRKWITKGKGKFSLIAKEIMTAPVSYLPGLPLDIESDTAIRYGDAK